MKGLIHVFLIIAVIGIASCQNCHNTTFSLSEAQESFSNFKKGSYWIMRDSITGKKDSFVVSDIRTSFLPVNVEKKFNDEVEHKLFDIAIYDVDNKTKVDTLGLQLDFGWSNPKIDILKPPYGYYVSFGCFYDLPGNNNNITINGHNYDSVSIAEYYDNPNFFKIYANINIVLLKIVYRDEYNSYVWEIDKADIIR